MFPALTVPECLLDAVHQGLLRARNDKVDVVLLAPCDNLRPVTVHTSRYIDVLASLGEGRSTAVAGGDVEALDALRGEEVVSEGVLTTASSKQENAERLLRRCKWVGHAW